MQTSRCLVEPRMRGWLAQLSKCKFAWTSHKSERCFKICLQISADIRYQSQVHPSFSAMIAQMSPLDAENLELFKGGRTLPIARYKYTLENDGEKSCVYKLLFKEP